MIISQARDLVTYRPDYQPFIVIEKRSLFLLDALLISVLTIKMFNIFTLF